MFLNFPKNTEKIHWTSHSKQKMKYYRLSEKRVLSILRKPDRKEEGIAPGTVANMQITGTKKHPTEAWMMYQLINSKSEARNQKQKIRKLKIISAWRYPGRTPEGARPIIPEDVLRDLSDIIKGG